MEMTYSALSDQELAVSLRSGDEAAFTELYERYQGLLYIYACKIMKDEELAEDVIQELFIALWDKRETIDVKKSFSSYLYSAVRFRFFDLLDKQKVRADYAQSFQLFLDKGEYQTDNYVAEKELAAIIEKEINSLPEKMREVLLLSRRENLTNKEIAERLNISEKTVKNQLSSALKVLRVKLGLLGLLYFMMHL